MNPAHTLAHQIREGALRALNASDPDLAAAPMAAIETAMALLREELAKAHALQIVLRLEKAFRERPDVDAFHVWARSMDFGVCLGRRDGPPGDYAAISKNDRSIDPRAAAFYADPANRAPGDDPDSEPDYMHEDYVFGPFHLAFDELLSRKGPRVEWDFDEGTDWIPRGDALSIADALGMDWMRPWVERAEIHLATGPADGAAPRPRL